jgi:hypothetical protein
VPLSVQMDRSYSTHYGNKVLGRCHMTKPALRRPRRRLNDNIRMGLGKTELEVVEWMHLAQDRDQWRAVTDAVMNVWAP